MALATLYGHAEIVEHLLNEGFNVNLRDEGYRTPLHYAVLGNQIEISRLLISKGAEVDAIGEILDQNRSTPLHLAVRHGDCEVHKWKKRTIRPVLLLRHIWFVTFQRHTVVTYQQLISCLFLNIQKDLILFSFFLVFLYVQNQTTRDLVPEIIDLGPMCITDLFQNKYVAYFNPK